jgi:hypothetical protein
MYPGPFQGSAATFKTAFANQLQQLLVLRMCSQQPADRPSRPSLSLSWLASGVQGGNCSLMRAAAGILLDVLVRPVPASGTPAGACMLRFLAAPKGASMLHGMRRAGGGGGGVCTTAGHASVD